MTEPQSWQASFWLAVWLLSNLAGVGLWDIYVTFVTGSSGTVSHILGGWFRESPILAVAVGVLIGHLAWPR